MKENELIDKIAEAIAVCEGYYVTMEDAYRRGLRYPTLAQRNENPGNIRKWRGPDGAPYPRRHGFVDFVGWAEKFGLPRKVARKEGWRVLKLLIQQYISGRYHNGKSPTLYEFFEKYAPSDDGNFPKKYAEFVSEKIDIPADKPLKEVIENDVPTAA